MALPSGWHREYEGRHGAEFFYEPRNLTVSVLPRYDRAFGRASERDSTGFAVRVHKLLSPGPSVSLTLGERETFAAATELARTYMARLDARRVRSSGDGALVEVTDAHDDAAAFVRRRNVDGDAREAAGHRRADGDA